MSTDAIACLIFLSIVGIMIFIISCIVYKCKKRSIDVYSPLQNLN